MIPADLAATVALFLDRYIVGALQESVDPALPVLGPGIRMRSPAVVSIAPEYDPLPNGLDNQVFLNGTGPEAFPEPRSLYLDRCPLERTVVTPTGGGINIDFIFVVRFNSQQFDPNIRLPVCLPSGDELISIVSECLNKVIEFLGMDDTLGGTATSFFPSITTTLQVLTRDDFLKLELPDVQPA